MALKQCKELRSKTPDEEKYYTFDFSEEMESTETISSASTSVSPATGLTVGTATCSGETVQVRVSGGTAGVDYLITVLATTSTSEIIEGVGKLKVRD